MDEYLMLPVKAQKLKGFTILELIVSLGIGAMLLGLGLAGFVYFQRSTVFNQTKNEYILVVRDTQNKARNAVALDPDAPLGTQVAGYALYVEGGGLQIRSCLEINATNVDCSGNQGDPLTPQFSDQVTFTAIAPCNLIFFERVTGKMYAVDTVTGFKSTTANCAVTLRHSQDSSLSKTVQFNVTNGTFTE